MSGRTRRGFLGALLGGGAAASIGAVGMAAYGKNKGGQVLIPGGKTDDEDQKLVEVEQPILVTENIAEEFKKAVDDHHVLVDMRDKSHVSDVVRGMFQPNQWEAWDPAITALSPDAYADYVYAHQDINRKYGLNGAQCHPMYI